MWAALPEHSKAVALHKPKMVVLTSPNNPDGSIMTDEEVHYGSHDLGHARSIALLCRV